MTISWGFLPSLWPLSITLVIIFTIIITQLLKFIRDKSSLNLPPGSYGWPILGETLEFIRTLAIGCPEIFFLDRIDRYREPRVFKTSLFGESMVVLCGPAGNKFLFGNENKLVTVWWPASVRRLIGESIVTTSGVEGMLMRKMVSYFFTPDAFSKLYIQTMDIVSQQHINTHWQGKDELLVYPAIKLYTFQLACRLFMSIEEPRQVQKLATLFNIFTNGIISIPLNFPGTLFHKAVKATAAIKKELQKIVQQRKASLGANTASTTSQDLLSHLLVTPDENGKFMSDSVVVNNVLMVLFAGHDTTSSTITLLVKALAEHPPVLEKVLAEQNEIASLKGPGEFLQWEDIKKMKYSWNVVSETMRLWPPIVGAFKEALTDISYAGYQIPKGWKLYWSAALTHKDSRLFPEHAKFDPTRFEHDNPIPYGFVPFGGGARMCLGKEFARLEMLVFLHNVVRRFKWKLAIPGEKIVWKPIAAPEKGLLIQLHQTNA